MMTRANFLLTAALLTAASCSGDSTPTGAVGNSQTGSGSGGGNGAASANIATSGNTTGSGAGTALNIALGYAKGVSQDELTKTISDLEGFGTRYTFSSGDEQARDYLVSRLAKYGLSAQLDPFTVQDVTANNIIARKSGSTTPEHVYIFSAHYDSTSDKAPVLAPGADDNASGVAAVLEAARILESHSFESSLWFVFTAAEEQGSLGSRPRASTCGA